MYILDEVDAALDMSHSKPALDLIASRATADLLFAAENIGRLFRTRFKGSQFIVVSLKDGLFSNANGELRLNNFRGACADGVRSSPLPRPLPRRHECGRTHQSTIGVWSVRQGECEPAGRQVEQRGTGGWQVTTPGHGDFGFHLVVS